MAVIGHVIGCHGSWLGIQKKMDKFAIVVLILDDKVQLVGDCTEDGNNKQTINSETCDLASAKFTETNFTFSELTLPCIGPGVISCKMLILISH